jgi:hypothetical protein
MEPEVIGHLATEGLGDCSNCFQLLGVDVIVSDDFQAKVIEVNGIPSMQLMHEKSYKLPWEVGEEGGGWAKGVRSSDYAQLKLNLTRDVVRTIATNPSAIEVARDITRAWPSEQPSNAQALHPAELEKLIRVLAYRSQRGGFEDLYPSAEPLSANEANLIGITHTRSLKICEERKSSDQHVCGSTNWDFEKRFGGLLRAAIVFQDQS